MNRAASSNAGINASASAAQSSAALPAASSRDGGEIPLSAPAELGELSALGPFFASLAELEQGERREPVHVLWLGDSHSAADFLPNAVRSALAQRFGNGGPGFVHVGVKPYRHSGVKIELSGRWHTEPIGPSTSEPQSDGVYGLGGMRTRCTPPACRASVELTADTSDGPVSWDVLYRLPKRARLRIRLGEQPPFEARARSSQRIERVHREAPARAELKLEIVAGSPELFGVIVERSKPGVVLDTLGINGARLATALAWNEDAWIEQAAARRPELVVLAYGTNEAFERRDPQKYRAQLSELLGRVRRAAPGVPCLVLGPPDIGDTHSAAQARVPSIDAALHAGASELGCAFFGLLSAMGGPGTFERWADASPPLAAPDRVHLTPRGYEELGARLSARLLAEYAARREPSAKLSGARGRTP